jgi:seipin
MLCYFIHVNQVLLLPGMFMVCIQLHDKDSLLVDNSCRSTMLHYRSYLLHTLSTLIFSPMMVFGNKEEKQNIALELFADFEEDQVVLC